MEITKEYARAYVEVLEIIKLLPSDLYKEIPKERIEIYEQYKDEEYKFSLDTTKKIETQISDTAKSVISNLFVRFLAKENDREKIFIKERKENYEKELSKKSVVVNNDLFEKKTETFENVEQTKNEIAIVKKTNFFEKVLRKIVNFFKMNK